MNRRSFGKMAAAAWLDCLKVLGAINDLTDIAGER